MTAHRDIALSAALLATWALAVLALRLGAWAPDLSALYVAGWFWAGGDPGPIYAAPPGFFGGGAADWAPAYAALGIAPEETFAYIYPPLWAALVAPLTRLLSPQGFIDAVALVQIPMMALSVALAGRLARPRGWSWLRWTGWGLAVLTLSVASVHAIMHNQPGITVAFLILLSFERLKAGHPVAAGVALALAAALKLTPAALVVIFILNREGRALGAFGLAGATLAGLSVALTGWPLHQAFLAALAGASDLTIVGAFNGSLHGVGVILTRTLPQLPAAVPAPAWLAPALAVAALALVVALALRLRRIDAPARIAAAVLALAVILQLFGPLGWLHYYLLPLLLLPALLDLLPRRMAWGVIAPAFGVLLMPLYFAAFTLVGGFQAAYVVLICAIWLAVPLCLAFGARQAA